MSRFIKPVSVAVSNASVSIRQPVVAGETYEVIASDAKIWVNVNGAVAAKSGDGCIPIPAGEAVNIKITEDNNTDPPKLTAIRDAGTDGIATVSQLPDEQN